MSDFKACSHCGEKYSLDAPSRCQVCGQEIPAALASPDGAPVVSTLPLSTPPPVPAAPPPPFPPTKTGHLYVHQWQTASCPFVVPRHIFPGTPEGYFLDEVTRRYRERLAWQTFFTNTLIVAFLPLIGLLFVAPFFSALLLLGLIGGVLITYSRKKALWSKVLELRMEPGPWAASLEANVNRPVHVVLMVFLGLAVSGGMGLYLFGFFGAAPRGVGIPREQRANLHEIPAGALPATPVPEGRVPAQRIPAGAIPAVRIPAQGAGSAAPVSARR